MLTLWPQQAGCLIIGHRGACGYAPENTLVSFEEGIRRGADLLEMDVQLSKDNEVVVMHDTSVERTTNGEGHLRDLSWRKIKTLDAGGWYNPEFSDERVPHLSDVISRFRNRKTARRHPVNLVVELKTVRGSGGSLADAVVALLHQDHFLERVIVISFDAVALQEVRAAHKSLPIGLLYSDGADEARIEQALAMGAHALFPRKTCVTAKGVAAAHKAGLALGTWTANTKNETKRLLTCGADAIATNYPDRLRALLE